MKEIKGGVKNQPYEDTEKIWAPDGIRTHDPSCSRSDALTSELLRTRRWARIISVGWTCEPHLAVTQSITSNTLGLTVSHSHINSKKCLTHEGASNQPTYTTDINIIKEIKGDVKNQPWGLSSSGVRTSDLEHGGSWVRIPSGARIFCVLLWLILYISIYFIFIVNKYNYLSKCLVDNHPYKLLQPKRKLYLYKVYLYLTYLPHR